MTKFVYTNGIDDASGMDITMVGNWISTDTNWRETAGEIIRELLNERPELHVMNLADYTQGEFIQTNDPIDDMLTYFDEDVANGWGRISNVCVMIEDETNTIMIGDDDTCSFDEDYLCN